MIEPGNSIEYQMSSFMDTFGVEVMLVSNKNGCRLGTTKDISREEVARVLVDAIEQLQLGVKIIYVDSNDPFYFPTGHDDIIH